MKKIIAIFALFTVLFGNAYSQNVTTLEYSVKDVLTSSNVYERDFEDLKDYSITMTYGDNIVYTTDNLDKSLNDAVVFLVKYKKQYYVVHNQEFQDLLKTNPNTSTIMSNVNVLLKEKKKDVIKINILLKNNNKTISKNFYLQILI